MNKKLIVTTLATLSTSVLLADIAPVESLMDVDWFQEAVNAQKTGWTGTVAFSGVIPAKYQNRFKA